MHELSIIKNLFTDLTGLANKQKAKKITKVFLRMGEFTEINEEIVRFFFKEKSKNTLVQNAELNIEKSPNRELTLISFDCE